MKIIAHRGNDGIHKENSLEAIINSLNKDYVDGIECDVRLTKDNKLILNHDPFYNGHLIKNTKLIKLQRLGLNSLDEVLKNIKSKKIIMIELKTDNINKMIKSLIKIINKYNLNYYICSFNYECMKKLKQKYSNLKCGLIITLNSKHIHEFDFISVNHLNKTVYHKEMFKWTVNSLNEIKENIITDYPDKFKTVRS